MVAPRRCMHCREVTKSNPQRVSSTLDGDDEPRQGLENVLQQSVRQSIRRAQDRSKDSAFRQPGCCPLLDAFCDFARSTGSKVPVPPLAKRSSVTAMM